MRKSKSLSPKQEQLIRSRHLLQRLSGTLSYRDQHLLCDAIDAVNEKLARLATEAKSVNRCMCTSDSCEGNHSEYSDPQIGDRCRNSSTTEIEGRVYCNSCIAEVLK